MSAQPYHIQKLQDARSGPSKQRVVVFLSAYPEGATYDRIADGTGLQTSSVCGRIGDLRDEGKVYTTESSLGRVAHYDPDPDSWEPRKLELRKAKQLGTIEQFVADYKSRMDGPTYEGMKRLYVSIRNKPL